MSGPLVIVEGSVPRLAAHVRLRFDKQREQWVLLAPERIFVLDEIALAIVERCQGSATSSTISPGPTTRRASRSWPMPARCCRASSTRG